MRLVDGTEATFDTKDNRWHAADQEFAKQLDGMTFLLEPHHYRNRAEGVARAIAEELGAEVIYADVMEKDHGGPSALY